MTAAAKIRYRVLKKCFVNDQLYDPANMPDPHIMAAPGLASIALKIAPEGSVPPAPDARDGHVIGAPGFDLSATRAAYLERAVADLEQKLAERDEEMASAENAVADLQSKLDAERAESAAKIAELEKQIADLTKPQPKAR